MLMITSSKLYTHVVSVKSPIAAVCRVDLQQAALCQHEGR